MKRPAGIPLSAGRLFAVAVTAYGLGLLGWLVWPAFRESFVGKIVAIPPFSIYVFEHLGIPGLTDRATGQLNRELPMGGEAWPSR